MADEDFMKKRLASFLNRDKVKLWEEPFTNKDGSAGNIPQELITKFSNELNTSEDAIASLVEELRTHALQKLAEKEKFKQSGKATLKIKVSRQRVKQTSKQPLSLEIKLLEQGKQLRDQVSDLIHHPGDQMKLICSGLVLKDDLTLQQQNVRNGSLILVLCLAVSELEAQQDEKLRHELQDFRHAAELLSARAEQEYDEMDIQIADQTGKPIQLPAGEKKALTLAIALHEKGRQALKKKNVTLALPLLLEADKEFKQCRADILNSVDNYAILCLDIVWCYLCLKHMEDLPDADARLRNSENFFQKSYGSSMERLMAVKGSTGEELALFMKLHLLQGIVAYHQDRMSEAAQLLGRAESELQRLTIDEDKLNAVMTMGFSEGEARLGLRACDGNIQNAVAHIMKRREEKEENEKKREGERKKNRLQKHLGKTADGKGVKVESYEMLIGMGYPKGAAAEALRQANNDLNLSLEVLQNHPEYLSLPDPVPKRKVRITDEMIAQVTSMGFEPEMAKWALQKNEGNVGKAIEDLIESGGSIQSPLDDEQPGTSGSSDNCPTEENQSKVQQQKEEKEAINRLVSDLPEDEEDYLDLTLDEEREFLQQYQSMLNSLRS
ncbi:NEDD8 ultimate buster 1-like [Mya arenaria]|uniref:NEDD8 ultimate buster 1-like n=1 Tax=Mya arenaria TaxID=6604 RepID=UPI0022E975BF|nr:NEDD8 ultimate buster 1-like [Mya arenaria]